MTDEANRLHTEALIGGDTRWRAHLKLVLGVRWDRLPLKFRQGWWRATDYGQHPPESEAEMAELLAPGKPSSKATGTRS
jgi:hypothetical protein